MELLAQLVGSLNPLNRFAPGGGEVCMGAFAPGTTKAMRQTLATTRFPCQELKKRPVPAPPKYQEEYSRSQKALNVTVLQPQSLEKKEHQHKTRPSNSPLLDSKYHQIRTIRFQLRVVGRSR